MQIRSVKTEEGRKIGVRAGYGNVLQSEELGKKDGL